MTDRSQSKIGTDINPFTDDFEVHYRQDGSTSNSSIDENEKQISSAREQLSSIPDGPELLQFGNDSVVAASPPEPPIGLSQLIDFVGASKVFDCLPIKDVLEARQVSRYMKDIVDNYFLHYILPQTAITCYVDHIIEEGCPPAEEYQHLYPVIRRIDKDLRIFPHGRVVFEPDFNSTLRYTYRHGSFRHVELKFDLGDWRRRQKWPLDDHPSARRTPYSYKADGYRKTRKIQYPIQYTRMHQFIRFDTFNDSPIHVFYKEVSDSGGQIVVLHAISIPLNYLRHSLCTSVPNWDEEPPKRTIIRSNHSFDRKSIEIMEDCEESKCREAKDGK